MEREDIAPAPYVGRYKWVILNRLDALHNHELRDLLRQSYVMVAASAPRLRNERDIERPSGTTSWPMLSFLYLGVEPCR